MPLKMEKLNEPIQYCDLVINGKSKVRGQFARIWCLCTHGSTYEKALQQGQEVLELLIEDYQARGKSLPAPLIAEAELHFSVK